MEENEIWMKKLKERLEDYAEPVPAAGWEQLEKQLLPAAPSRIYLARRWTAAAAAMVLLAVGTAVSLYFLGTPAAEKIRQAPMARTIPLSGNEEQELRQPAAVEPQAKSFDNRMAKAEQLPPSATGGQREEPSEANLRTETPEAEKTPEKKPQEKRKPRKPSGREMYHLPAAAQAAPSKGWSFAASAGNAGIMSGNGAGGRPSGELRLEMSSASEGAVHIPGDHTLVFKDGVPYLQRANEIAGIKHRQPVTFGLSVRKELKRGFSVETGLSYTLLSSEVTLAGSGKTENQKLHYIGIPLRANWSFMQGKRYNLYLSAGGAVEKCVYGSLADKKETVDPLQLSVTGAVGAQFNATRHLGFYVEPGVAYFFDDGSPVQTIRKETPVNFSLQAGVRFTY